MHLKIKYKYSQEGQNRVKPVFSSITLVLGNFFFSSVKGILKRAKIITKKIYSPIPIRNPFKWATFLLIWPDVGGAKI